MKTRALLVSFLAVVGTMAFASSGDSKGPVSKADAAAHAAHENYVTAINSNNLEKLLGMLTEDIVYLAPNSSPLAGKAAVTPWVMDYLKAYKTHWDKPVVEFIVSGQWAFERYSYTSTDTPIGGGDAVKDTGWGLVIYHLDADGKWRVARDAWGSDQPVPTPAK